MEYFWFDLNINKKVNGQYPISAKSETFGGSDEILSSNFETPEFISSRQKFDQGNYDTDFIKSYGSLLFNSLFQGNIRDLFRSSVGEIARNDQRGIRIRLCIEPPEISAIHWELLYDLNRDSFLATSTQTPLTRYINVFEPIKELKTQPPVRILVLIPGGSGLDTAREKKIIVESLEKLGERIQLKVLDGTVTRSAISKEFVEEQYHILHFIGHGAFERDEGYLAINSEKNPNELELVSSKFFTGYFKDYPSMKLVVLNSCQGAEVSEVKALAGMGPQLVRKGVPSVIAMQDSIPDQAAVLFATEFYRKLCTGWDRGRVDSAISYARNRMQMDFQDTSTFALPVLFMRSPTGIIFDLDMPKRPWLPPIDAIHRLEEVKKTYQANLQLLEKVDPGKSDQTKTEIDKQKVQIARIQGRLRRYYFMITLMLMATGAIFFASRIGILNVLGLDDWTDKKFIQYLHPYVASHPAPDLKLILANEQNGSLGPPDRLQWRCYNAELLQGLSEVGARVVMFDLFFDDGLSDCDRKFADAIRDANARGTTAIIGARKYADQNGKIVPETATELKEVLQEKNWGTVSGREGVRIRLRLAEKMPQESDLLSRKFILLIPSIALQAVMQGYAYNQPGRHVNGVFDPKEGQILLRNNLGQVIRSIPVEDGRMEIIVNPVERIWFNKRPYAEVRQLLQNIDLLADYAGKIVVVGYEIEEDKHGGRFGVEIQASAISNLLVGGYFEPLRSSFHYLVIAVMMGIGALLNTRLWRWMRYSIPFELPVIKKQLEVPFSLLLVAALYLGIAFILYKQKAIILNLNYHLLALVLGYLIAGWTRKGIHFGKVGGL